MSAASSSSSSSSAAVAEDEIVIAHDEAIAARKPKAKNVIVPNKSGYFSYEPLTNSKIKTMFGKWPYRELTQLTEATPAELDVIYYENAIKESRERKGAEDAEDFLRTAAALIPVEIKRGRFKRSRETADEVMLARGTQDNTWLSLLQDTRWMNKSDPRHVRNPHEHSQSDDGGSNSDRSEDVSDDASDEAQDHFDTENKAENGEAEERVAKPRRTKRRKVQEEDAGDYQINHNDDDEDGNEHGAFGEGEEDAIL